MNYFDCNEIIEKQIVVSDFLEKIDNNDFVKEILDGLQCKQKYIPSKFFYDNEGSKLFDDITTLEEYYPAHVEKSILKKIASNINGNLNNKDIIELGNGDGSKMKILINAVPKEFLNSIQYLPVDYCRSFVEKTSKIFSDAFPELEINGIVADFLSQVKMIPRRSSRVFCFFGSTLGNLTTDKAWEFITQIRESMQEGDEFLIGIDMVKDKAVLERAYNDSKNVTDAFNKNILKVSNNIAGTNFNIGDFEHIAFFNEDELRIEMHLKALKDLKISSPHIQDVITINKDETIHTENSHKYTPAFLNEIAEICNFKIMDIYTDDNKWFSVVHFYV